MPGHGDLVHWLLYRTHRCMVHRPCTPVYVPQLLALLRQTCRPTDGIIFTFKFINCDQKIFIPWRFDFHRKFSSEEWILTPVVRVTELIVAFFAVHGSLSFLAYDCFLGTSTTDCAKNRMKKWCFRSSDDVEISRYTKFFVVIDEFKLESTFDQMNLFVVMLLFLLLFFLCHRCFLKWHRSLVYVASKCLRCLSVTATRHWCRCLVICQDLIPISLILDKVSTGICCNVPTFLNLLSGCFGLCTYFVT